MAGWLENVGRAKQRLFEFRNVLLHYIADHVEELVDDHVLWWVGVVRVVFC